MTMQKENGSSDTTDDYDGLLARFHVGQMQNAALKAETIRKDAEIDDMLVTATEMARETSAEDPNCYGAGYDDGYRDGLRSALRVLRSESDV